MDFAAICRLYASCAIFWVAVAWAKGVPEFPVAIQLISDISLGYFAKNGIYDLIDPSSPMYEHPNGCRITKMQESEDCGSEFCKTLCSNGYCYKASCPEDKENNTPPTLFMSCSEDGPQTCTIAEYATYEDPEKGRMIENTNDFEIEEVSYELPNGIWAQHQRVWIALIVISILFTIVVLILMTGIEKIKAKLSGTWLGNFFELFTGRSKRRCSDFPSGPSGLAEKEINYEWILVKNVMIEWIVNHVQLSIDDSLALWLDPTCSLQRSYKAYKNANPSETRDVRGHYLLDLWRSSRGSNVTAKYLISILENKDYTAEAIEELKKLIGNEDDNEEQVLIESSEVHGNNHTPWIKPMENHRRPRRRPSIRLSRMESEQILRNLPNNCLSRKFSSSLETISVEK